MPYNFYFIKFSPSQRVEASEAGQTPFRVRKTLGVGVWGCNPARNLSLCEEYLHAKFIKIGVVVWISIADIHAHTHTHIDFYILDFSAKMHREIDCVNEALGRNFFKRSFFKVEA